MKVLIYSQFSLWYLPLGIDLEIARDHIEKGDIVEFLVCDSSINICETNPNHLLYKCSDCINVRKNALKIINTEDNKIHLLNVDKNIRLEIPDFSNIEELKNFRIGDNDLGQAVASSLISFLREAHPNLENLQQRIKDMLIDSFGIYQRAKELLKNICPDLLYIHNGRHNIIRPVLRAAQNLGISLISKDSISYEKYYTVKNSFIQDLEKSKENIRDIWSNINDKEVKCQKAEDWYKFRSGRKIYDWKRFTELQNPDLLPDKFDSSKKNITIFNSSEDEFEALELWNDTLFEKQIDAIKFILENFQDNKYHFYIRIHPFLKGINNSQIIELYNLKYLNLTIISAESDVSTYNLLKKSDLIISFGSTVGVEAVYWGKPSILIGRAFYEDLNVNYIPKSKKELLALISSELKAHDKKGAVIYACWEIERGIKFKNYNAYKLSVFDGKDFSAKSTENSQMEETYNELQKYHKSYSEILKSWLWESDKSRVYIHEMIINEFIDKETDTDKFQTYFSSGLENKNIVIKSNTKEYVNPLISVCIPLFDYYQSFNDIIKKWQNFHNISSNLFEVILILDKDKNPALKETDFEQDIKIIDYPIKEINQINELFREKARGKIILHVNQYTIPVPILLHLHINFHLRNYNPYQTIPASFKYASYFSENEFHIITEIIREKKLQKNNVKDLYEFFTKNYSTLIN